MTRVRPSFICSFIQLGNELKPHTYTGVKTHIQGVPTDTNAHSYECALATQNAHTQHAHTHTVL